MPIKKDKKIEIVKDLEEIVKSKSLVFVKFDKLTVSDSMSLRKKLRENNIGYKVAKKTLFKRAVASKKIEGDMPNLEGEFAVSFGEDLIAPAREVYNFQKDHKDNIEIVGGVFDGKFMNKEEMMSIATIPSVQVLYAQFVNLINSPIQQFVVALNQIAESKK